MEPSRGKLQQLGRLRKLPNDKAQARQLLHHQLTFLQAPCASPAAFFSQYRGLAPPLQQLACEMHGTLAVAHLCGGEGGRREGLGRMGRKQAHATDSKAGGKHCFAAHWQRHMCSRPLMRQAAGRLAHLQALALPLVRHMKSEQQLSWVPEQPKRLSAMHCRASALWGKVDLDRGSGWGG